MLAPEQLLCEIGKMINEGDFASKVREFHSFLCNNGECDDDSVAEADRYVEKFKKYRARLAQKSSCTSNLKQCILAYMMYVDDHDGWGLPPYFGAASKTDCYIDTTMTFNDKNGTSSTVISLPVYYVGDQ
mgnify:CR=1 FL=1